MADALDAAVDEVLARQPAAGELGVTEPVPARPLAAGETLHLVRAGADVAPPAPPPGPDPLDAAVDSVLAPPAQGDLPEVQALRRQAKGVAAAREAVAATYGRASYTPTAEDLAAEQAVAAGGDVERGLAYHRLLADHTELNLEQQAQAKQLTAATGLPADLVVRNLPALWKRFSAQRTDAQLQALIAAHPALKEDLATDPAMYRQVRDASADVTDWLHYVVGHQEPMKTAAEAAKDPNAPEWVKETAKQFPDMLLPDYRQGVVGAYVRDKWTKDVPLQARKTAQAETAAPHGLFDNPNLSPFEVDTLREEAGQAPLAAPPRPGMVAPSEPAFPDWRAENAAKIAELEKETTGAKDYGPLSRRLMGKVLTAPARMSDVLVGNALAAAAGPQGVFMFNWGYGYGPLAYDLQQQKGPDGKPVDPASANRIAGGASALGAAAFSVPIVKIGGRLLTGAEQRVLGQATAEATERALAIPAVSQLLLRTAKASGEEYAGGMLGMVSQAIAEEGGRQLNAGTFDPAKFAETVQATAKQAAADLLLLSAGGAAHTVVRDVAARQAALRSQVALRGVATPGTKLSQVLEAAPDGGRELLVRLAQSSRVESPDAVTAIHQDLAQWDAYWTAQKLDPRAAAATAMRDGGKAYDQAKAEHATRLEIPVADWTATFGVGENAKHGQALLEDAATAATVNTPRQQMAQAEADQARAAELAKLEPDKMEADHRAVFEEYRRQALEADETDAEATSNAKIAAAGYKAFAERAGRGESAWDLWQAYPMRIIRGEGSVGPGASQPSQGERLAQIDARLSEITPATAARDLTTKYLTSSPEQQAEIYYRDPKTGLLNDRGLWDAPPDPERPLLAQVQISGKKLANDKAGHEALDRIFRAVGRELVDAGGDHVAKAGGDLYLRVKDQAELDRVMGVVRAKLPQWVELSAGLGDRKAALRETIDGINAVHNPVVEKRRAAGTFAQREGYPAAFTGKKAAKAYAKAISELPDGNAAVPLTAALRESHAALEPRAAAETAFRTAGGLLTETAWHEMRQPGRAKRWVASMDLRSIKRMNEALGVDATDAVLLAIERKMGEIGGAAVDAAHRSGDEFAWQHDDLQALHAYGLRLRDVGRMMSYTVTDPVTGERKTLRGVEFAIGEGKTFDEADGPKLKADKRSLDTELGAGWFERRLTPGEPGDGGRPGSGGGEASGPVQGRGDQVRERGGLEPGQGPAQDFPGLGPDRVEEVRALLRERAALTGAVELKQGSRIADIDGEQLVFHQDGERGFIRFPKVLAEGQPVALDLHLLNSDKSTLAHETFHGLSVVLGQLATRPDAPAGLRADYQGLLEAMGYQDHAERLSARDAAKEERASHLWEMYLAEGRAPSKELRPAFTRFKGWMQKIYGGLLGISDQYEKRFGKPLELSDDVRRIFDRMLAADDQVDRARAEIEPAAAPADVGEMPPADQAEYQRLDQEDREVSREELVRRAAEDDQSEARKAAAAEAQRIRGQVEVDVAAGDEGHRALAHLQRGEIPGQPDPMGVLKDDEGHPVKLDRKSLVREIGAEAVAALPRGIFAKPDEGGMAAGEVALRLAFPNAEALLDAIRGKDFDAAVKDEVGRRVDEKFGPALLDDPARAPAAAQAALATEAGAKKLMLRLAAIARALGPEAERRVRGMSLPAMHDQARELLQGTPIRQVSADRYMNMEAAAHDRATEAWKAGKRDQALQEVEAAVWNHVFARAARDVRDLVDRAEQRVRGTRGDAWRAALGKASPAYRDGHDAILAGVKMGHARPDAAGDVQKLLLQLVSDASGTVVNGEVVPDGGWDPQGVRELAAKPRAWSELTPEEALNVADAVANIRHHANDLNEITTAGKRLDREMTIDEGIAALEKNLPKQPKIQDDPLLDQLKRNPLRLAGQAADALELDIKTYAHLMDGGDRDGIFHQLFIDRRLVARDKRNALTRRFLEDLLPKFEKSGLDRARLTEAIDVSADLPLDARLAELREGKLRTRSNLLMMLLNLGNDSNAERFLGGYKWTREQVLGALSKHLNGKELRWVNDVWAALEKGGAKEGEQSLYQEMAKLHEDEEGIAPEKIKAKPFTMKSSDGELVEMTGGYFPARYDPRPGAERRTGEKQVAADVASFFQQNYTRAPSVASPHAKKRAAHFEDLVNLNWGIVPAHVSQVIHDIAYRRFVKETAALLLNDRMDNALTQHLGVVRVKTLRSWLRAVANARADSLPEHLEFTGQLMSGLKSGAAKAALGFSVPRAISDVVSDPAIAVATGHIRPDYMAKASAKVLTPARWREARDWVVANIPEVRDRSENLRSEMNKALGKMGGRQVLQNPTLRAVRDSAFITMELGDALISTPMALAKYQQALDGYRAEGRAADEAHRLAVRDAGDMIREVMPPHDIADKPALIRDHQVLGALLLFHGHANKIGGVLRRRGADVARAFRSSESSIGDKAAPVAKLMGTVVGLAIANGIYAEYFAGRGKTEDETYEQWVARKSIGAVLYPVPFLNGPLEALVSKWITGETKPVSIRGAPGFDFAMRTLKKIGEGVSKWFDGDGDAGLAAQQAAETLLGIAAGAPTRQAHDTTEYVRQLASGEADARGPLDVLGGLIYGNDPRNGANPLTDLQSIFSGD
jgi:GGDEF domain-containing protein